MALIHEQQLADLLEGTSDAAFAVDLEGEVRIWNKAAEKLLGYPAEFAIGKSCASLICGRDTGNTAVCCDACDVLEFARTGKEVSSYEMQVRTRSGKSTWVNVSLLSAPGGLVRRALAVHFMRDITEKKARESLTGKVLRMARDLVERVDEPLPLPPVAPPTAREKQVLGLLASGRTTAEITNELRISSRTLRNHIHNINKKLHTKSRIEAVTQAIRRQYI